jgi:hypothetical protein
MECSGYEFIIANPAKIIKPPDRPRIDILICMI